MKRGTDGGTAADSSRDILDCEETEESGDVAGEFCEFDVSVLIFSYKMPFLNILALC